MNSAHFSSTLLRTNASGYAALAATRLTESRPDDDELLSNFTAWKAQLTNLVLELAAEVRDGTPNSFATRVGWTRDAFAARGRACDTLREALQHLGNVLQDSLPEGGWAPIPEYFKAATSELDRAPESGDSNEANETPHTKLALEYLSVLEQGDGNQARELVLNAIKSGELSLHDALGRVLILALREVGRKWHANEINVAQEHFASTTTGRLIEQISLLAPSTSQVGKTVVLTMVEGDAHDLGLRIVAAFFELDGWRTLCLGANIPREDLALAAEEFGADLVVIGATLNTHRESVEGTVKALKAARPGSPIVVGGSAFVGIEHRATEFGADGCSLNPRHAVSLGRELVSA